MEEKKTLKVSLSSVVLLFLVFILIVALIAMYYFGFVEKDRKYAELENKIQSMQNNVQGQPIIGNTTANTVEQNKKDTIKELSQTEKEELYNKAVKNELVFIEDLIYEKDFSNKEFSENEIINSLPDYSNLRSYYKDVDNNPFEGKISKDDLQMLSKKYFGKELNFSNINSSSISGNYIIVELRSGVGVMSSNLQSVVSIGSDNYVITFTLDAGEQTSGTYKLTVNYKDGNVIYKSLEK